MFDCVGNIYRAIADMLTTMANVITQATKALQGAQVYMMIAFLKVSK